MACMAWRTEGGRDGDGRTIMLARKSEQSDRIIFILLCSSRHINWNISMIVANSLNNTLKF